MRAAARRNVSLDVASGLDRVAPKLTREAIAKLIFLFVQDSFYELWEISERRENLLLTLSRPFRNRTEVKVWLEKELRLPFLRRKDSDITNVLFTVSKMIKGIFSFVDRCRLYAQTTSSYFSSWHPKFHKRSLCLWACSFSMHLSNLANKRRFVDSFSTGHVLTISKTTRDDVKLRPNLPKQKDV